MDGHYFYVFENGSDSHGQQSSSIFSKYLLSLLRFNYNCVINFWSGQGCHQDKHQNQHQNKLKNQHQNKHQVANQSQTKEESQL